tara:strand:+ start:22785 stop:22970 length:186 start_codon:yes stop_codon:yes gene_type:complete
MHYDKIEACLNTAKIEINQSEKIENDLIKEYKELNDKCDIIINKIRSKKRKKQLQPFSEEK